MATFEAGKPGRHLALNGHIDVFPVGDGIGWTHDPWGGELVDGRIYGRGACDMKCGTTPNPEGRTVEKHAAKVNHTGVARLYRFQPIGIWPKWASNLLEVKTPANVTCKAAPSPSGGSNINIILALLDRTRDVPGDLVECGVFEGRSLTAIALYVRENRLTKRTFGLDSFQGFDESVGKDIALGGAPDREKRVGGFGATSLAHVKAKLAGLDLLDNVTLISGYFAETLQTIPAVSFSFVHLDCALKSRSAKASDRGD